MTAADEQRAMVAAAYWLDCSPHERAEADGLLVAAYAREARRELDGLRHACLAAVGWLAGQSVLTKEQLQTTLVEAVKAYATRGVS